MAVRRTFLTGIAVLVAGCLAPDAPSRGLDGDGEGDGESTDARSDTAANGTDDGSGYHLRGAPVGADDREPVLSSDDDAVAGIDPLVDLLEEVTETFEVTYASLSSDEAAAFEDLTADLERYVAGNPPGYYIDHKGIVVSVSPSG